VGRNRAQLRIGGLSKSEVAAGAFFVAATAASAAGLGWGVSSGFGGLALASLLSLALFGSACTEVFSPSLVVDEQGVAWRLRWPWKRGRLKWSEVAAVETGERYTEWGGGNRLCSAVLALHDGRHVRVAKGTLLHPWSPEAMREFAEKVNTRIGSPGASS
jgi:hypothetical protein